MQISISDCTMFKVQYDFLDGRPNMITVHQISLFAVPDGLKTLTTGYRLLLVTVSALFKWIYLMVKVGYR